MRKIYVWVAIVTIAITGCSKTEVLNLQDTRQVGYTAGIGKQIKSGPVNGTTFPTNDTNYYFSVLAFYKPTSGSYNYTTPYIDDVPVKWNNTSWMNETVQYWPTSGSLQFVAYAPFVSIDNPDYNATDGLILPDFDDAPEIDVMYTDLSGDLSGGTVPLTFKHALTQIYFTIATSTTDVTFTIKRLDVRELVGKGTFKSLPAPAWTLSVEPTWTAMQYTPYNNSTGIDIVSTDAAKALGTPLMLIPQPIGGIEIGIEYDVTYTNITGADNQKTGLTKTITLSGADWAVNQRIKYAITITDAGPNAITYEPTVTTWDAETPSGI